MATTKKCLCGCGEDVNPGRSFVQGHNNKRGAAAKYQTSHPILKMKHSSRRKPRKPRKNKRWPLPPMLAVIDELLSRRNKIDKLIETLREIY